MMIEGYADAVIAKKMLVHRGHKIQCVTYGATDENVALECVDCSEVIIDYEFDGSKEEKLLMDEAFGRKKRRHHDKNHKNK